MVKRGTVLVFEDWMTKEDCELLVRKLMMAGKVKRSCGVREFDPEISEPVWYLP